MKAWIIRLSLLTLTVRSCTPALSSEKWKLAARPIRTCLEQCLSSGDHCAANSMITVMVICAGGARHTSPPSADVPVCPVLGVLESP